MGGQHPKGLVDSARPLTSRRFLKLHPGFWHLLLHSLSTFISLHLDTKTLMFHSVETICVWTETLMLKKGEFTVKDDVRKTGLQRSTCEEWKRQMKGKAKKKKLVLHSLVLCGAFWHEWQIIA